MAKLRLSGIPDDRPVKITIELAADIHRDLIAYAEILAVNADQKIDATKLIAPMVSRFMATDRGFARALRARKTP